MSDEFAISVEDASKAYRIWDSPAARLSSPLHAGLAALLPKESGPSQWLKTQATKSYRDFWALRDVSLMVKKGEAVGIVGRNGSGKSTLLQIIAGTLKPTTGTARVNGRIAALLELGSGFNPEFTGRENIYLNGAVLGLSRAEIDARFDQIASFADIGDFLEQPVKTYSSGMVLRLAFATQAMINPEILIVDEALAVGDEAFQRKCIARIEHLKSVGTAILFVSHSAQTIIQLCDRALMLDSGRQILAGQPKDVVHFYQKFLYASVALKKEMLNNPADHTQATPPEKSSEGAGPRSDPYEFFLEGLKSESHVIYDTHGAQISDCVLTTPAGVRVNHLRFGREYDFKFAVSFEKDISDMAFGMMIATVNGVEISGASTWGHRDKLRSFTAGQKIHAAFRFTCLLQDGLYFIKCGIATEGTGFIHRQVDVLNFKVSSPARRIQSGFADLGTAVRITSENGREVLLEACDSRT